MSGFDQEFIAADLAETPLLARLWPEHGWTNDLRVEWDGGFNYCQLWITRIRSGWDDGVPLEPRDDQIASAMRVLAREVEFALLHGVRWMDERPSLNPNKAWCVGGIGTDGITEENAQILVEVGPRVEPWPDGYVIRFAWTLAPRGSVDVT